MRVKPSSRCHDAVRIPGRLAGGLRAIGFTCDRQSRVGKPHSGRARHCGIAPLGAHDPPGPAARKPGTRVSWPLAARGAFAGSVSESPCSSGTEGPRRRGDQGRAAWPGARAGSRFRDRALWTICPWRASLAGSPGFRAPGPVLPGARAAELTSGADVAWVRCWACRRGRLGRLQLVRGVWLGLSGRRRPVSRRRPRRAASLAARDCREKQPTGRACQD